MASDDEGEISSPDPLTQNIDFIGTNHPISFPSSALRPKSRTRTSSKRAPRTRDRDLAPRTKQEFGSLKSAASIGSPRKQTFELDVGSVASPQRILVTVEAEDPSPIKSGNTRRMLFEDSSPTRSTRRARSTVRDNTTTTTVPLKNGETPRKRGRPKGGGTPRLTSTRGRAATPRKPTPARTRRKTREQEDEDAVAADQQESPSPRKRGRPRTRSLSPEKPREAAVEPEPEPEPEQEPELDTDLDIEVDMSSEGSIPHSASPGILSPARSTAPPESVVSEVDLVEYNDSPGFGGDNEDYFLYEQSIITEPMNAPKPDIQPVIEHSLAPPEDPGGGFDDLWMAEVSPPKRRTRGQEAGEISQASMRAIAAPVAHEGVYDEHLSTHGEEWLQPPTQDVLMSDPPRRPRRHGRRANLSQNPPIIGQPQTDESRASSPPTRNKSPKTGSRPASSRSKGPSLVGKRGAAEAVWELAPQADNEDEEMGGYDDPASYDDGVANSDYSVEEESDPKDLRDNDTVAHAEDFTMISLKSVPSLGASFQGRSSFQGKSTIGPVEAEELNDTSKLIVDRAVESIKQQAQNEVDDETDLDASKWVDDDDVQAGHGADTMRMGERSLAGEGSRVKHRSSPRPSQYSPMQDTIHDPPHIRVEPEPEILNRPVLEVAQPEPSSRPSKTPSPRKIKNLPLSRQLFAAMSARKPAGEVPLVPQPSQPEEDEGKSMYRASTRSSHLQRSVFDEGISELPSAILGANTPFPHRTSQQATALQQPQHIPEVQADVEQIHEASPGELAIEESVENPEAHSSPHKLLTPDQTPSPGSIASEYEHATIDEQGDEQGGEQRDDVVLANETVIHSSPPVVVSHEQRDGVSQPLPQDPESTARFGRPEIRLSSPQPRVESDISMADAPPVSDSIRRPTLSPILRAGRTLQNILSDPISPRERRNSLGSPFRSSVTRTSHPPEPMPIPRSSARLPSQEPASSLRPTALPVTQDPPISRSPASLFGQVGQVAPSRAGSHTITSGEMPMQDEDPFTDNMNKPQQGLSFLRGSSISRDNRGLGIAIVDETSRPPTISSFRTQPPDQGIQREMNEDSRLKTLLGLLENPESRNTTINSSHVELEAISNNPARAGGLRKEPVSRQNQEHLPPPETSEFKQAVTPAPSPQPNGPAPTSFPMQEQAKLDGSTPPVGRRGRISSPWMRQSARRPPAKSRLAWGSEPEEFSLLSQPSINKQYTRLQHSLQPPQSTQSAHLSDFFSSPHPVPLNPARSHGIRANMMTGVDDVPGQSGLAHSQTQKALKDVWHENSVESEVEVEPEGEEELEQGIKDGLAPLSQKQAEYDKEPSLEELSQDELSQQGTWDHDEPTPTPSKPGIMSPFVSLGKVLGFNRSQTEAPTVNGVKAKPESRASEPAVGSSRPEKRRPVQTDLRRSIRQPVGFSLSSQQSAKKGNQPNMAEPQSSRSANLTDFFSSPQPLPPGGAEIAKEPNMEAFTASGSTKENQMQPTNTRFDPESRKPQSTSMDDILANLISPVKEPPLAAAGVPSRKDPAPVKAGNAPASYSLAHNIGEVATFQPRINPPKSQWHPPLPQKSFFKAPSRRDLFAPGHLSDDTNTSPQRNPSTPPDQTDTVEESESFQYESIPQKKNFTPRPGGAAISMFHPDAAYLAAQPARQSSSMSYDESSLTPRRRCESLRPLPTREASPSKSCLRSPVKPKKVGRVVAFTGSTLSPLDISDPEAAIYVKYTDAANDKENDEESAEPMDIDDNTIGIDWEAAAIGGDESVVDQYQTQRPDQRVRAAPQTMPSEAGRKQQIAVTPDVEPKDEPGSGISMSAIPPAPIPVKAQAGVGSQEDSPQISDRGLQSSPETSHNEEDPFDHGGSRRQYQTTDKDVSKTKEPASILFEASSEQVATQDIRGGEEYYSQYGAQASSTAVPPEGPHTFPHRDQTHAAADSGRIGPGLFAQPPPKLQPRASIHQSLPSQSNDRFSYIPYPLSQTQWTKHHWARLEQLVQARKTGKLRNLLQSTTDPGLMLAHPINAAGLEDLRGQQIQAANKGVCMEIQDWQVEVVKAFAQIVGGWDARTIAKRVFSLTVGSWAKEEEKRRALKRRRDEISVGYRREEDEEEEEEGGGKESSKKRYHEGDNDSMADSTLERVLLSGRKKTRQNHHVEVGQERTRRRRRRRNSPESIIKKGVDAMKRERQKDQRPRKFAM